MNTKSLGIAALALAFSVTTVSAALGVHQLNCLLSMSSQQTFSHKLLMYRLKKLYREEDNR